MSVDDGGSIAGDKPAQLQSPWPVLIG